MMVLRELSQENIKVFNETTGNNLIETLKQVMESLPFFAIADTTRLVDCSTRYPVVIKEDQ